MAIPWTTLDMPVPERGAMIQLKLGRKYASGGGRRRFTWPFPARYEDGQGHGRAYFESANSMVNHDMAEAPEGRTVGWGIEDAERSMFSSVSDGPEQVIRFEAPGRYATASQSLKLKPNSMYRLDARVRGSAGVYLRARTARRKEDKTTTAYTVESKPSDRYEHYSVRFPTGETGRALVMIGNTAGLGNGETFIADMRVAEEIAYHADGPAIPQATVIRWGWTGECIAMDICA